MINSSQVIDDTISVTTSDTAQLISNEEASTSNFAQLNKTPDLEVRKQNY